MGKEMFKELKRLRELKRSGNAQINFQGYTPESLESAIDNELKKLLRGINELGWFLVFILILPAALMQLGLNIQEACLVFYLTGGAVLLLLKKLTGKLF